MTLVFVDRKRERPILSFITNFVAAETDTSNFFYQQPVLLNLTWTLLQMIKNMIDSSPFLLFRKRIVLLKLWDDTIYLSSALNFLSQPISTFIQSSMKCEHV